ncbi:hypothetical protein IFM89_030013 [Coptis chinensis]|uniref:BHLH domain-containing protein n=1 Tax=Coptis chinensis TaxID=261450 RepID=A0A835IQQ7_9MAGN|nr:hypothetical protein IFM89_030013 [Coptis chinensis]
MQRKDLSLEELDRVGNFPHSSRPLKAENGLINGRIRGSGSGLVSRGDFGESSVMTIGSNHCGSNQLPKETDLSRVSSNGTLETNSTSSSGGSGGSFIGTYRQSTSIYSHKRKGRDANESEYHSEDAEFESANANKAPPRSGSTRRSRAAEVHNLSERRRRDRINEKMRALQELIPHCNKSDKALMLDEAIEYLKSLQLQVQMMGMGSGMVPMMFPGVQHYISRMGMGMGTQHSMPSTHSPMQLPRQPLVNQTIPTLTHLAPLSIFTDVVDIGAMGIVFC